MTDEEQMAELIRGNDMAHPNSRKPVYEIRTSDITYLDDYPCEMSDLPLTFDIRSLQEDGHLGGIDESLGLVLGVSVIDGKEFDETQVGRMSSFSMNMMNASGSWYISSL